MARSTLTDRLRTIGTIYRFSGARASPEQVDLENPVSLVHDVAPDAGRVASRWLQFNQTHPVNAGLTTYVEITTEDVFDQEELNGGTRSSSATHDVWLMDAVMSMTTASVANIGGTFLMIFPAPIDMVNSADPDNVDNVMMARFWNTSFGATYGEGSAYTPLYADADYPGVLCRLPRRIARVQLRASAGGGGSASYLLRVLFCITPRGVAPTPPLIGWL